MPKCLECGESFYDPGNICAFCLTDMEKRSKFRELMTELKKISELPESSQPGKGNKFMHGFSYAEQENFSLIFRKLQKKFHFPLDYDDFSNSSAITKAKELYITEYSQILDKAINPNDKTSMYNIRRKLEAAYPKGWYKSTLSDVLCFCINKGYHAVEALECKSSKEIVEEVSS